MNISFEYYRIFYYVAKYENITKAAMVLKSAGLPSVPAGAERSEAHGRGKAALRPCGDCLPASVGCGGGALLE